MEKLSAREKRIVVDRPRSEIARLYGTGAASNVAATNPAYHNLEHTINVDRASMRLAAALSLSSSGVLLVRAAANNHDRRQLGANNEAESAELAVSDLRELGKEEVECDMVRKAILGTEVRFYNGRMIQKAVEQEYPTKMHETLAHIVASGDLGLTYTPWGPYYSHMLYKEMCELKGEAPDITKLLGFQIAQVDFMMNFRYASDEHGRILATHRAEVMHYVFRVIKQLESGAIASWEDLIEQDIAFANSLA